MLDLLIDDAELFLLLSNVPVGCAQLSPRSRN